MNALFKWLILFFFITSFLYAQTPGDEKRLKTGREVVKKFYEAYSKLNSFSVDFREMSETKNITGKISFEKPDKYYIKYSVGEKENIELYLNDGVMDIYLNRLKIVLEENIDNEKKKSTFTKMGLNLFDTKILLNNYTFKFDDKDPSLAKEYHVYLKPKNKEESTLEDMEIWISPRGYILRSLVHRGGQTIRFKFFNMEVNLKHPDNYFKFEVPPNVEKIYNKLLNFN